MRGRWKSSRCPCEYTHINVSLIDTVKDISFGKLGRHAGVFTFAKEQEFSTNSNLAPKSKFGIIRIKTTGDHLLRKVSWRKSQLGVPIAFNWEHLLPTSKNMEWPKWKDHATCELQRARWITSGTDRHYVGSTSKVVWGTSPLQKSVQIKARSATRDLHLDKWMSDSMLFS